MAFKINTRSSGSRLGKRTQPMGDINVTPLVDVMLVLLIVFMITAPLLNVGVQVDLPKTEAAPLNDKTEPLVITINQNQELFLQDTKIEWKNLIPRLEAISQHNQHLKIYVRGDQNIHYGKIMELMGMLSNGGFEKVALIAEMPSQKR